MRRVWIGVGTLLLALLTSGGARVEGGAVSARYMFFLTHYEFVGDANSPSGVRYRSTGRPSAKSPDGSVIALSGAGTWDPYGNRAAGGGQFTVTDAKGKAVGRGAWRVRGFVSFEQMNGWWEAGFKQYGWQGPPGSVSFPGFLTVSVTLDRLGNGVLLLWCLMPTVAMPGDHQGDGLILVGPRLNFTRYQVSEMSAEGVMFYSTDPRTKGYALRKDGTTFLTSPAR